MKKMIKMRINPVDYRRYMGALNRILSRSKRITNELNYRNAANFHTLLVDNIYNADAKYGFHGKAPYSHRYAAWKKSWGNFWVLYGDLVNNIVKKRTKDGWAVGVPKGIMDSGGKSWFGKTATHPAPLGKPREIAMYAYYLEYGRKGQKPRPIVGPTREEYADGDWQKTGIKALVNIGAQWR